MELKIEELDINKYHFKPNIKSELKFFVENIF